jgi:hypothetical protein
VPTRSAGRAFFDAVVVPVVFAGSLPVGAEDFPPQPASSATPSTAAMEKRSSIEQP